MSENESRNDRTSVLFVCLGNICRSPTAEGVFRHLLDEEGLSGRYHVDSAGTGAWHVGEPPDARSTEAASRYGVRLAGAARQIVPEDFERFDWVIAMDRENLRELERMRRSSDGGAALHLLREFDLEADHDDVPDPYYGGPSGFDDVYQMVLRSCRELLRHIEADGAG